MWPRFLGWKSGFGFPGFSPRVVAKIRHHLNPGRTFWFILIYPDLSWAHPDSPRMNQNVAQNILICSDFSWLAPRFTQESTEFPDLSWMAPRLTQDSNEYSDFSWLILVGSQTHPDSPRLYPGFALIKPYFVKIEWNFQPDSHAFLLIPPWIKLIETANLESRNDGAKSCIHNWCACRWNKKFKKKDTRDFVAEIVQCGLPPWLSSNVKCLRKVSHAATDKFEQSASPAPRNLEWSNEIDWSSMI